MKKICATVLSTSLLLQGVLQPVYSYEMSKPDKEEIINKENLNEEKVSAEMNRSKADAAVQRKLTEVREVQNEEPSEPAVIVHEGTIGTATWTIDSNGVLKIGEGSYASTEYSTKWPWKEYDQEIKKVDGTAKFYSGGACSRIIWQELERLFQ